MLDAKGPQIWYVTSFCKVFAMVYTLKKHQKIQTIAIFQKFLTQQKHWSQWRTNILNDTTQFSEDMREIYIEKFTNIGTSDLRWDISRFFNDVTDVNGFLPINAIIVHMTVHFLQWCVNGTEIH